MPENKKRERDRDTLSINCYTDMEHFLWLKALAAELSLMRGYWVRRKELWTCLVKRAELEKTIIPPVHTLPKLQMAVAIIDRKIEPTLNSLELEFGKRNPTLSVSDSLFLRSLVAHFAQMETPHACAERCNAAVPAPRRNA